MSDGSELRVSDEQRDRAAAEVREHYAAGRLDEDELSERLDAIYKARTEDELRELRKDLPVLPAAQRAELAERRSVLQRRLIQHTGEALVPFLICTVVWVAAGASGAFWPIWVALFALIPLVRNGWDLYGPEPRLDRVERHLSSRGGSSRRRHGRRAGLEDARPTRQDVRDQRQRRRSDRRGRR
jgi:Domain of unknown function (DUF1707)